MRKERLAFLIEIEAMSAVVVVAIRSFGEDVQARKMSNRGLTAFMNSHIDMSESTNSKLFSFHVND